MRFVSCGICPFAALQRFRQFSAEFCRADGASRQVLAMIDSATMT
jgi:hypothetical protein